MATFGNTGVGASTAGLPGTYIILAGPFTAPANGNATGVSFYSNVTVTRDYTFGLYDSTPTNRLADTAGANTSAYTAGGSWYSPTLDSPYSITASTVYWSGYTCDNGQTMFYDVATSEGGYQSGITYSSGSTPATVTKTTYNRRISAYIDYTASGSGSWLTRNYWWDSL